MRQSHCVRRVFLDRLQREPRERDSTQFFSFVAHIPPDSLEVRVCPVVLELEHTGDRFFVGFLAVASRDSNVVDRPNIGKSRGPR